MRSIITSHKVTRTKDPTLLDECSQPHQSFFVRIEVAANRHTSRHTLRKMLMDENLPNAILYAILRNPQCTEDEYSLLQDSNDVQVIRTLLSHIKTPSKVIHRIIENHPSLSSLETEPELRKLLLHHPNCPENLKFLYNLEN